MQKGLLVSNQFVLDMIKDAMLSNIDKSKGFLIDGYPRQVDQGAEFDREIVPCEIVLYIEASDETMKKRLLKRGLSSGRVDDNEESIIQRLDTFHEVTQPVVDYYEQQDKLKRVDAEKDPDEVFEDIKLLLDENNEYIGKFKRPYKPKPIQKKKNARIGLNKNDDSHSNFKCFIFAFVYEYGYQSHLFFLLLLLLLC